MFDALGAEYERAFGELPAHHASLDRLLAGLPPGSRILDVGSGTGRPAAARLSGAGHTVLGVDASPVMVDLATRQVPGATFRHVDIRELPLEEGEFDAVCVYFSLLQMDRTEQAALLRRLALALRPGGYLAVATIPLDVEGLEVDFMGQPVRLTSFGAEEFTALIEESGLTVEWRQSDVFVPDHPEATPEPQLFLHARRPGGRVPAGPS
ncbi:class I SAM-dependent methyltransferase [Streptomyces sp. NPDC000594]|uniref:class I SAM-dependent methyltransferase n=1 Tax=Streptomyces sp. NPDC000594 TaxID=3154261 RepID=UPI0033339A38